MLFLDGMSCRCLFTPTSPLCHLRPSCLIDFLSDLYIDVSGELKFYYYYIICQFLLFMSISICFRYLGAAVLGAYMLTSVIITSSFIAPFIVI